MTIKKDYSIKLSILIFKDNGSIVAYSPALEVYGYGTTVKEAKDSFQYCLKEFIDYAIKNNTLLLELKKLGWQTKPKEIMPPSNINLLKSNKQFSSIFETKDYSKYDKKISFNFA